MSATLTSPSDSLTALAELMPAPGALARLGGKALYWSYRAIGRTRHDRQRWVDAAGMRLLILPHVFDPVLLRTGVWFASLLSAGDWVRDRSVLEIGTGSGVCALAAARTAREVTAVDINPHAVRCARINALLQGQEQRMTVLQGDLYGPLGDRRFDRIVFNPPFLRGTPRDAYDHAWRGIDIAERFAAGLAAHLTPQGEALLLVSTYGGMEDFCGALLRHGCGFQGIAIKRYFNETTVILRAGPNVAVAAGQASPPCAPGPVA
jgi:HemK-related putative methylase